MPCKDHERTLWSRGGNMQLTAARPASLHAILRTSTYVAVQTQTVKSHGLESRQFSDTKIWRLGFFSSFCCLWSFNWLLNLSTGKIKSHRFYWTWNWLLQKGKNMESFWWQFNVAVFDFDIFRTLYVPSCTESFLAKLHLALACPARQGVHKEVPWPSVMERPYTSPTCVAADMLRRSLATSLHMLCLVESTFLRRTKHETEVSRLKTLYVCYDP